MDAVLKHHHRRRLRSIELCGKVDPMLPPRGGIHLASSEFWFDNVTVGTSALNGGSLLLLSFDADDHLRRGRVKTDGRHREARKKYATSILISHRSRRKTQNSSRALIEVPVASFVHARAKCEPIISS